jgi:hypothetical protein
VEIARRAGDGLHDDGEEGVCGVGERSLGRDPPLAAGELPDPVGVEVSAVVGLRGGRVEGAGGAVADDDAGAVVRLEVEVAVRGAVGGRGADGDGVVGVAVVGAADGGRERVGDGAELGFLRGGGAAAGAVAGAVAGALALCEDVDDRGDVLGRVEIVQPLRYRGRVHGHRS